MITKKQVDCVSMPCIFLLIHSYWIQYFTSQLFTNIIYIACFGLLAIFLGQKLCIRHKSNVFVNHLLWLSLAMISLLNNWDFRNGRFFSAVNLFILIILMMLLSLSTKYFHTVMKFVKEMALLFAFFTIVMFVGHLLMPGNIFFANYKSSITSAHYSSNAVYLSFGAITLWSSYIIDKSKKDLKHTFFILIALFITGKRSCFTFACATILFLYFYYSQVSLTKKMRNVIKVMIAFAILVPIATLAIPQLGNMFGRIQYFFKSDKSFGNRIELYAIAINMFRSNPLFGTGWGAYKFYFDSMNFTWQYDGSNLLNAHNVYLQVLAESGIIGEFIYVLILSRTIVNTLKIGKRNKDNLYIIFSTGIQIFFLLYSITGNPLYDTMFNVTYFITLGMTHSIMNRLSVSEMEISYNSNSIHKTPFDYSL